MLYEVVFNYIYDAKFLYQVSTSSIVILAIILLRFLIIRYNSHQLLKNYGIPGPKPSFFGGNLSLLKDAKTKLHVYEGLRKKYGKLYGLYIGDKATVTILDLDTLKKIFHDDHKAFTERSHIFLESPITHSILFAKYDKWRMMRKSMSPSFSKYTMRGDDATQFVEDSVKLMIDYIEDKLKKAQASGTKAEIDVHDLMKSTALHLISNLAIKLPNVQVKEKEENVALLDKFLASSGNLLAIIAVMFPMLVSILQPLIVHFRHDKFLSLIHKGINKYIDETLLVMSKKEGSNVNETGKTPNVMGTLIKLLSEGKLTRTEVVGNADALLAAGYDTTSTTLTYIFWVLARHNEVQEILREDLKAHGVNSKYLEQVIKETMRIYPTVLTFTSRLATQTVDINGISIPRGCAVVYNAWLMFHDPELWPEPMKFDPERFQESKVHHPCAFAPFGLGNRKCLGFQLALLEMKMIICDVMLRFKLRLISPERLEIVSYATVLTKPKDKVVIELEHL